MVNNPFLSGNPVAPDRFLNRKREIRRIISRILSGQSVAIVGEPRSGKTSLLLYLAAPEMREALYREEGKGLLFSYLDSHTFGGAFDQPQFWRQALRPLYEQVIAQSSDSSLLQAYTTCKEDGYGTFVLERLLIRMAQEGWRLVLMLDEFDVVLHHPVLHSTEFFGGLRSLATRSRGALTLVLASRCPLERLNEDTQDLSRTGSPYFNFLHVITLGPFPATAAEELLRRDTEYFTPGDRRFLRETAGEYPYLLQAAASALWEAYDEGIVDVDARWVEAGGRFYGQVAPDLSNIWRHWTTQKQRGLTAVGLGHISSLDLGGREFRVERLAEDLDSLGPEIRDLKKQGFIAEDTTVPGGWCVRPGVLLWWLADEIVRLARDDTSFGEWLLAQERHGQLAQEDREALRNVARKLGGFLEKGVATLIEAAAKGLGSGLARGE